MKKEQGAYDKHSKAMEGRYIFLEKLLRQFVKSISQYRNRNTPFV